MISLKAILTIKPPFVSVVTYTFITFNVNIGSVVTGLHAVSNLLDGNFSMSLPCEMKGANVEKYSGQFGVGSKLTFSYSSYNFN